MEELDEVQENQDLGVTGVIDVMGRLAFQVLAYRDQQLEPVSRERQKGSGSRQMQYHHPQGHPDPRHYSGSYHHDQCLVSDYCRVFPLLFAVFRDLRGPECILGPLGYTADMEVFLGRLCCL
jgi:hypothetical protein